MSADLQRFLDAQRDVYDRALQELRAGRKTGHWMWFIFPQVAGLGHSAMSRRYAISSLDEARAYARHPTLGARLRECAQVLEGLASTSATEVFGQIDAVKLRSCMTLFALADPDTPDYRQVLERYFGGERDPATERLVTDE